MVGGQSFAWHQVNPDSFTFEGIWSGRYVQLEVDARVGKLSCRGIGEADRLHFAEYLNLGDRHRFALDRLPWRSDPVLERAIATFRGLRILRQPVEEVLFCFLCSSAKSIIQIRQILNDVSKTYGREVIEGRFAFPGWPVLNEAGEKALRDLKLGYRARFVSAVAESADSTFFEQLKAADYLTSKAMLLSLPGIGEKIADCVCLFGLGHGEAFPVDTWIARAMGELYGLDGWSLAAIAQFGRAHFGADAGLAQQYIFSYARARLP